MKLKDTINRANLIKEHDRLKDQMSVSELKDSRRDAVNKLIGFVSKMQVNGNWVLFKLNQARFAPKKARKQVQLAAVEESPNRTGDLRKPLATRLQPSLYKPLTYEDGLDLPSKKAN